MLIHPILLKNDLANVKSNVDKLDIDKLKNMSLDKLNIGKLETTPVDLFKLSDLVEK